MLIERLLDWWGRELLALVPESLRRAARPQRPALRLELTSGNIRICYQIDGQMEEIDNIDRRGDDREARDELSHTGHARRLERYDPHRTRVIVAVAPELGLSKDVELPLAVEENLEQSLSYQIERETPFRRDDVYFGYRVLARDVREKKIRLSLHVVPREIVNEALQLLSAWELQPAGGPAGDGQWLDLRFQPRVYHRNGANRLHLVLAGLNGLLLVALIAVTFVRQTETLDALQTELAAARKQADKAADLRDRVREIDTEQSFLARQKKNHIPVVSILEELSSVIPDTTWLYQIEIKDSDLNIQGVSDSASSLITPIESSPLFHDTRLGASVAQEGDGNREHFRLSTKVGKSGSGDAGK